ncbi:MAG: hypothetical protein LBS53_10735 [Synergistaceae bacterium]|nr:hypothetical protein [Synergistaceae bacterium]
MSVCVITAVSAYSLMQMFALTGLFAAGGVMASAMQKGKEAREALRKAVLREIEAENGRIDKICDTAVSAALRGEIAAVRAAAGGRLNDDDAARIFEEIKVLSLNIRRAEVDEGQCSVREASILALAESIGLYADISTKEEIKRLSDGISRARSLSAEARMANLQGIMDELIEIKEASGGKFMSEVKEIRYEYGNRAGDDMALLVRDIRDLAGRIAFHDEIEGERLAPLLAKLNADTRFPERLKSLHRQFKALWGKIREREASTSYFRETLSKLKDDLSSARDIMSSREGADLLGRCGVLLGAKFIERPDFMKLYEDIAKFVHDRDEDVADSMFAGKVKDILETLGYEIVQDEIPAYGNGESAGAAATLEPGAVRYLDSPYEGYRVMLKAGKKGSLTARLVRVEDGADEISRDADEQEMLDRETGREWCRDFDAFMDKMRDIGLPMEVSLRQEPEEAKLMTVPGRKTKRAEKRRKKNAGRAGESRMMSERGDE